jgi:hypothetical protein
VNLARGITVLEGCSGRGRDSGPGRLPVRDPEALTEPLAEQTGNVDGRAKGLSDRPPMAGA